MLIRAVAVSVTWISTTVESGRSVPLGMGRTRYVRSGTSAMDETTNHRQRRTPAAVQIASAVEGRIVKGDYLPGERLDEAALEVEFNVSRTPVREALVALAARGLVEQRPRSGTFVAELTLEDLFEAYEVSAQLEGLAARLAARRMSPSDRQQLVEVHNQIGAVLNDPDRAAYVELDERFHQLLVTGAGNLALARHIAMCRNQLAPVRRGSISAVPQFEDAYAEHSALVDAIVAGDADEAERIMKAHVALRGERARDLVARWRKRVVVTP